MSEIEVKIRDDKAMLYTPYNPEFVKRIKKFSDWSIGKFPVFKNAKRSDSTDHSETNKNCNGLWRIYES